MGTFRGLATGFRWVVAACSLGVAAAPCTVFAQQQVGSVKIGGQSPPVFEYVYRNYAVDEGFLARQGLKSEFVGFTAGVTSMQALASGSVDFACEGISSILAADQAGADFRIVIVPNAESTYLILANDSIAKPEDVVKKKWAVSQVGAISQTYAFLWLDHFGLKNDAVDWIPVGGTSARARALIAGQVDVTMVSPGEWLRIKGQKGVKMLSNLAEVVPPLPLSACATTAKMVHDKPDVVQRYVNGMLDAIRFARTPEGKKGYLASLQKYDDEGFTPEQQDQLFELYLGHNASRYAIDPNGGMNPEVFQNNMKSLIADGTIKQTYPLDKIWDSRFVEQYLAENGWYDTKTGKAGLYLRDLIKE